ncbi:hypothetical protein H4R19_001212 [Coemansia spiralis]|nr:hypothetical protein H4R19_001212 [Coemansia spiralis]
MANTSADGHPADLLGQRVILRYVERKTPTAGAIKPRLVAVEGKERQSGIGGYGEISRKSGIGNHVMGHRDSGIGKLCFDEEGGWMSRTMSNIRKLPLRPRLPRLSRRNSAPALAELEPELDTSAQPAAAHPQSVHVSVHEELPPSLSQIPTKSLPAELHAPLGPRRPLPH